MVESSLRDSKAAIQQLKETISKQIIGQDVLVERMLVALLADGHILVEGAPGLAKTRAINVLSKGIEADFHRVQFTPDLLPSDLTGTDIYRPQQGTFEFQKGPLFHNLVLADEINRFIRSYGRTTNYCWWFQLSVAQFIYGNGYAKPIGTRRHLSFA